MKKIFRNVVAAFAAVMLVSAFASCSDSDDGDDKKQENPTTPKNKDGKEQGSVSSVSGDEITFPVTAASTNAENTVLLIKYNRSAAGADELISISDAELKVLVNGTVSKLITAFLLPSMNTAHLSVVHRPLLLTRMT